MTSSLPLDKIRTDGGTQSRATINAGVVDDYAQAIRDGADFPAVDVFYDGKKYWLADGFHRHAAYEKAGAVEIAVSIHQGTKRDAVLFSVGANAAHGLRRTNDDKRRAVMVLLGDKEWARWSDRQIAKQCGVSHNFVSGLRPSLSSDDSEPRTYTTKHGTMAKMDTAKIGKRPDPGRPLVEDDATGFDLYAINGQERVDAEDGGQRQRLEISDQLSPEIKAMEAAKAERRTSKRAEDGDLDAVTAERDELIEANAALETELADARRQIAKYDDMAVEYERGGFENVIAGLNERIELLKRQVERESQEKVKNLRSAAYWKKKAIEAGANADVVVDMETGEMSRG